MFTNLAFTVPGAPQGKGRARATKTGRMYTPAQTVAYESLVRLAAAAAMGPGRPMDGPLALEIEAVHAVPPSWSNKRRLAALAGELHPVVKPDFDNVAKAIGDAGNGVVWVDDRQIVRCLSIKRYGARPEVQVRVAALGRLPCPG